MVKLLRWIRIRSFNKNNPDPTSELDPLEKPHPIIVKNLIQIMVLILDSNSLRGAHVRRNICYSTCSRHFITSRAVTNWVFLPEKIRPIFLHACATCN